MKVIDVRGDDDALQRRALLTVALYRQDRIYTYSNPIYENPPLLLYCTARVAHNLAT